MTALSALYQMVYTTLRGDAVWENRVYPDMAVADTVRPYVVYFYAGGGEELVTQVDQHARIVLTVKCVADTMAEAFAGAARIQALLRSQGSQESAGIVAAAGLGWTITTVTQDRVVHVHEQYQGADAIYHEGHQFVFQMEATGQ